MIRKMCAEEVDVVVDIWFETSIIAHGFIDRWFWEDNRKAMREIYIPNSETWVYQSDGSVVGFYSLAGDSLAAIFVLPAFHGQGIGGKLLEHAKRQRGKLELTVYTENKVACSFYRKRGFVMVEEQVDDNTGHAEHLMMWFAGR